MPVLWHQASTFKARRKLGLPYVQKVRDADMNSYTVLLYVLLWQTIYFSMFLHFFITTAIKEAHK